MRRIFILLILCAGFLLTCSFEKPSAPSWDTQLNMPMIDNIYTIQELIEGEENLRSRDDGLLAFHFEKELDTTFVGDHLTLPEVNESFALKLDAFLIPDMPVEADRYTFSQLTSESATKNGTTSTIAPFSFNNVPSAQHTTADLRYAVLNKGMVRIYVYNILPVELQNVLLTLQDPATSYLVVSTPLINKISVNDSVIADVDVTGKTFPPNCRWLISGNSPGSNGRSIPINQNNLVAVVAELRDCGVSAAEARIPSMTIARNEEIALAGIGANAIEELVFSSGTIQISIDNQTPFTTNLLSLRLLQFHLVGTTDPLQINMSLKPFTSSSVMVDLRDVTVKMELPQIGQPQYVQMEINGTTADMRNQFVTINEQTRAQINVEMRNVKLDHFSGRLEEQIVKIDSTVKEIEISDRVGDLTGVRLADARMQVELYNTIQIPIRFQGTLWSINDRGETASLTVDQIIFPGTGTGETLTKLPEFNPQNSGILSFINIQPMRISAGGQVKVGDGMTYGHVKQNDYIRGRYTLDLPIYASWEQRSLESDISQMKIETKSAGGDVVKNEDEPVIASDATSHLLSAKVLTKIDNHLPVGGQLKFYFATDSTRLFDHPDLLLGPVSLQPASVDQTGKVVAAKSQEVNLEITNEDIKLFQNDTEKVKIIYMAQKLTLEGTGGKQVKIYLLDYVRVQGLLQLLLHVGDEEK